MRLPALLIALLLCCAAAPRAHAATPTCGAPNGAGASACSIDATIDPGALCADGTVPAYWYRPGSGSGINTWLFWMGGGGSCDSKADCAVWVTKNGISYFLTSNGFLPTPGKGITSPSATTNPALYNANTVYLHYCSADNWTGGHVGPGLPFDINNTATWNFLGRRIAIAQIKSIAEFYPAFASASTVILGGDSSGGAGIISLANDLLPLLPATAQKLLVSDAGFSLDIGQYDLQAGAPYMYPLHPNYYEYDTQQRLAFWQSRGDAVCDAHATTSKQHGDCYSTGFIMRHGYIKVPSFVAQSMLDTAQVTYQLCPSQYGYCQVSRAPNTPMGMYETEFSQQMAIAIVSTNTRPTFTGYAPDLFTHVILNDDSAFVTPRQFAQGNIAPRDVFDAWFANPTAPRVTYIGTGPGVVQQ